jgi:drug/metabolite transporter (DMT)-like permease
MRGAVRLSWPIVGGAVAYAATVTLFVAANRLTTSANTIFLQSSAPIFLVILAPLVLRERFRPRDIAFLFLIGLGMWLAFSGTPPPSRTAPNPSAGNSLALVSSLTWALTLLSLRYLERTPVDNAPGRLEPLSTVRLKSDPTCLNAEARITNPEFRLPAVALSAKVGIPSREQRSGGLSLVILGNLVACLFAVPALVPWPVATMGSWITVSYLGVAQIAIAYVCLTASVRHLPALDVSLLLLLEPVLNPVWTWLVHGEQPGYAVVTGGALILASTAVRAVLESRDGRTRP